MQISSLAPGLLLLSLHGPVEAQAAAAKPSTDEPVVVIGALQAQRAAEAPYAISVVPAEALRSAGPLVNLSEALVRVPGLVANDRHNYAQDLQLSARGFGARAGFGVRGLRLYADGLPATMPDGQGQVVHFDLAGAQRIEVLRGPFSVLYGNSSGGVIALFSAPVDAGAAEAALDDGSFGLRQGRFSLATPLAPGWDLRLGAAALVVEGFRPHSAARRTLGSLRLGWQGEADRLLLRLADHSQRADDPLGLTRAQFDADPRQTTAQATQYDSRKIARQTQLGLSWRHGFTDAGPLRESQVALYQGLRGVTQWQAIPVATQAAPRHGGGVVDFDRDFAGLDARLLLQLGPAELVAGLDVERQRDERRGYENFAGSGAGQQLGVTGALRRDERNIAVSRDGYAQLQWPLDPAWTVSGGLRSGRVELQARDRYLANGDDSGRLAYDYSNPVLGLRWTPSPGWMLHASAARGFESPTLGELAYRPDGQSGFNSGLRGQSSRQFEAGAKWRRGALELDAALFRADTADEIGVLTNSGGRSSFGNVGRTRRQGVELSGRWQAAPAWRLQGAASALQAHYRDGFLTCTAAPCSAPSVPVAAGNRIAGTQGASAWAEAAWRPGAVPGEFALEWRAVGRTAANDTNTEFAAGYALVHLRWSAKLPLGETQALELLARVDNLADRVHIGSVIVNDGNGRYDEPGAPRSLLLSLRWLQRW